MSKTSSGESLIAKRRDVPLINLSGAVASALAITLSWCASAAEWPADTTAPAAANTVQSTSAQAGRDQSADSADRSVAVSFGHTALRYDTDYPELDYAGAASNNPVARLQSSLDRGEVKLKFNARRGYLDSVLQALKVDPSSQTLVYSKTSLQIDAIRAATPRAIYFNDDTYVAWVQGADRPIEIVAMDRALGPVFYTLPNHDGAPMQLQRETSRCLTCHDSFSMMGGGVPRFLFMSTVVSVNGESLTDHPGIDTTDQTPLSERWGGWFVTGRQGELEHLGNILAKSPAEISNLASVQRGNLDTLDSLLDTRPYITDKSDIVALLVFEHQAYIHNLITRANFKSRTVLSKEGSDVPVGTRDWNDLLPKTQVALRRMLEPLVRAMLFADAAGMNGGIKSGSGFDKWFQAQGPRDRHGRSLRQLDLNTRLFRYPMSFLVYSQGFDGLPDSAKGYIYSRFREVLSGQDASAAYSNLSASDRTALLQILSETKPEFAKAPAITG
jgi:hypothetical protein